MTKIDYFRIHEKLIIGLTFFPAKENCLPLDAQKICDLKLPNRLSQGAK